MESGEYFLKEAEKRIKKTHDVKQKQTESKVRQKEKREKSFIPPPEDVKNDEESGKKRKHDGKNDISVDIEALKKKAKKHKARITSWYISIMFEHCFICLFACIELYKTKKLIVWE